MHAIEPSLQVVLKVTSRCNLNCTYCYVYNKGDRSWSNQPTLMSDEVFAAALERTRRHCYLSRQPSVTFTFHGGEPCLIGKRRVSKWCDQARKALDGTTRVKFCLQTNGTLIDSEWATLIKKHDVDTAVSMDGPEEIHDAARIDHH